MENYTIILDDIQKGNIHFLPPWPTASDKLLLNILLIQLISYTVLIAGA